MKALTYHEIIYCIPVCGNNENCRFIRSYVSSYIGSEVKFSLKKILKYG